MGKDQPLRVASPFALPLRGPERSEGTQGELGEPEGGSLAISEAARGIASPKFLGSDPKAGEERSLQMREIRDLSLNADLVTLSARGTGVGALAGLMKSRTMSSRSGARDLLLSACQQETARPLTGFAKFCPEAR
jgi:hypothetical protein